MWQFIVQAISNMMLHSFASQFALLPVLGKWNVVNPNILHLLIKGYFHTQVIFCHSLAADTTL